MDVYSNTTRELNRHTKTSTGPQEERGEICSVDKIQTGVFHITSTVCKAPTAPISNSFLAVLSKWGCAWLWEHMRVEGGTKWISEAIQDGSLIAVTDGSYIRQLHLNLCLAAFVPECMKGHRKIIRSFSKSTLVANLVQRSAPWFDGYSFSTGYCEQSTQHTGWISGGGIQLFLSIEMGGPSPTILDPFALQALGHLKKHTR
jgi:hypothetical protein